MNAVVAGVGIMVLLWLAVLIGAALDTRAQRVQRQYLAAERRRRAEDLRRIDELRGKGEICRRCPLRRLDGHDPDGR